MQKQTFYFGHLPEPPDARDYKFKASPAVTIKPIDLSWAFPPVRNQGTLGSCTAFATAAMVEFVRNKQKLSPWTPSPLFTYYATRKIEGTTELDSGAYVRDALKSTVNYGSTREEYWPYITTNFAINPPDFAWQDAEKHQALVYFKINQIKEDILSCLSEGYPFTFGAKLYQSFIDTQTDFIITNYVPMPDTSKEAFVGGHCMLAVGFTLDENNKVYIKVRNSWDYTVGLNGYHYMPIEYFLNPYLSMDFWTIRTEESVPEDFITPSVTPTSTVTPTPTVTGTATPTPTVTPTPSITPSASPIPFPKENIWKTPRPYAIIFFIIFALFFLLIR